MDEDSRRLACALAGLGHFEEALRCQAHASTLGRLHAAEARKKDAVERDDFEGAIKIRSEIQALAAEVAPAEALQAWRQLVGDGCHEGSLDATAERLLQRCQYVEDALGRAALMVTLNNFRTTRPPSGALSDISELPGLVLRQRRARQMSRAIEALTSSSLLRALQALLVCLSALGALLGGCMEQLNSLTSPDWSQEERALVTEAAEFQSVLRGLAGLRRMLWRLGLTAGLLLPASRGGKGWTPDGDLPREDETKLKDLYEATDLRLREAQATWARLVEVLAGLELTLETWETGDFFEVGGGGPAAAVERHRGVSAPLCALCLLPAVPLGLQAETGSDAGAASALWRGGLWHVQCANFWLGHVTQSQILKDMGLPDPFAEPG